MEIDAGMEFDTRAVLTGVTKENLIVKFFWGEEESQFTFDDLGNAKKTKREFVSIKIPGSDDEFCTRVRDSDKIRFAAQYNAWKAGQTGMQKHDGFPIDRWERISEARREILKALGFHTLEQLAGCSDSLVGTIGFDGVTVRREAIKFLADNKNTRIEDTVAAKEELEVKLSETQKQLADQSALTQKLLERLEALEKKTPSKKSKV